MKKLSLYIHIPFCKKKCNYCNFTSFACCDNKYEQYFSVLYNQIRDKSTQYANYKITSIFIGGGTPSIVNAQYIVNLIKLIKNCYTVSKNCEITIECNPDSTTIEKLIAYKQCGINRISFGVQTLNNNLLQIIGRVHNKNQAINAIQNAQKVGFKNINADVMLGLPNQTKNIALSTVKKLTHLNISHISLYTLILEENTKLYEMVKNNQLTIPTEEETVKMFDACQNYLKKLSFIRYEVANFAKLNKQCKHNMGYWNNADYLGFGIAAHSKINNTRFYITSNFKQFINGEYKYNYETLTKQQIKEEKIMLGLRTNKGININLVKNKQKELNILIKNKLVEVKNNNVIATQKGFYVLNQIILMLL